MRGKCSGRKKTLKEIKTGLVSVTRPDVAFGLVLWWSSQIYHCVFFLSCVWKPLWPKYLLLINPVRARHAEWRALKAESLEWNRQEGVQNCAQRDKHKYLVFTSRAMSLKFLTQSDLCIIQSQYSRFERRKKEDKKHRRKKKKGKRKKTCKRVFIFFILPVSLCCFTPVLHPLSRAWAPSSWIWYENVTRFGPKFDCKQS